MSENIGHMDDGSKVGQNADQEPRPRAVYLRALFTTLDALRKATELQEPTIHIKRYKGRHPSYYAILDRQWHSLRHGK